MRIFSKKNKILTRIKEIPFKYEKHIQEITEANLETIFSLRFVSSEFQLKNLRFDTLAYDEDVKAFVIIEFKKDKSFSVIDQGFAYLSHMLANKAEYILEYNDKCKEGIDRDTVDWTQSRVLFISNSFTVYQKNAINFKDLPIELWEVHEYTNDTIAYTQVEVGEDSESINKISSKNTVKRVSKEVKKYTIDDHFKEGWNDSREIFEELRKGIKEIDDEILERFQKYYIAYKKPYKKKIPNFTEIVAQAGGIEVYLDTKKKDIDDPKNLVKDCSKVGHWATGNSRVKVRKIEEVDYVLRLVRQVYDKVYS